MADFCYLLVIVALAIPSTLSTLTNVDLTGPGCDMSDGYYLKSADDTLSMYAYPQYNVMATRDHCDVTIRADTGRRIQYIIETIYFNECGVEIILYDNPTIDVNPIHTVTCSYNSKVPIQGKTNFNVLRLRVRKTTPESRAFTFTMRVKNDLGPPMEFEKDTANWTGQTLEPSVIAGIAVAGSIVVIAAILIAIFLCMRARSSNLKDQSYDSTDNKSSEFISSRHEHTLESQKKYPPSSQGIYSTQKYPPSSQGIYSTQKYPPSSQGIYSTQKYPPSSQGMYSTQKEGTGQWRTSEPKPPRRMRPPIPEPTQPAPRDPGRKGLSDRHRSGERTTRSVSQPSHVGRRERESMA